MLCNICFSWKRNFGRAGVGSLWRDGLATGVKKVFTYSEEYDEIQGVESVDLISWHHNCDRQREMQMTCKLEEKKKLQMT